MASSSAFASAPTESPPRESHFFMSSSPDLKSIHELLSRRSEAPPFKASPRRSIRNLEGPLTTESQSLSATIESIAGIQHPDEDKDTAIEIEDVSLIEIEADAYQKARTTRAKANRDRNASTAPLQSGDSSANGQKPWRRFRLKDDMKTRTTYQDSQDGEEPHSAAHTRVESVRDKSQTLDEPLNLEPAMTRRLDWTPPVKRNLIIVDSSPPIAGPSDSYEKPSSKAREFEQLLDSYKCAENLGRDTPTTLDDDPSCLRKRKLIEMVATTTKGGEFAENAVLPNKAAKKKKARTITELAMAAYKPDSPPRLPTAAEVQHKPNDLTAEKAERPEKKGGKAPAKPKNKTAKKKAAPRSKQVLLPPDEALREVAKQDFLFGTSSQLAKEKSPTFLRYVQQAMKESNETDILDLDTLRSSNIEETPSRRSKLWEAGARDEDGALFDVEMSNLADMSPEHASPSVGKSDPFGYLQQGKEKRAIVDLLDDSLSETKPDDPFSDATDSLPLSVLKRTKGADAAERGRKPSKADEDLSGISVTTSRRPTDEAGDCSPQRPSYDQFTDAQLATEIRRYGFKPVRLRKARIALLEQCWQSRAGSSHHSVGVGASASFATKAAQSKQDEEPAIPEMKKRRGRPRKSSESVPDPYEPPPSAQPRDSPVRPRAKAKKTTTTTRTSKKTATTTTTTAAAALTTSASEVKAKRARVKKAPKAVPVEIPDSASDGESSDSSAGGARSPREASFSPPLADLVPAANEAGLGATGSQLSSMLSHVTKAVKSAPRTTDPAKPSWHEKILLYDPIILEDLTDWLNGGELRRVGFEDEVSVAEVKKWCESRSICCLKRENLRGQERKRY